jgi:uncharacterized protein (DUF736 family)
MNPPREEIGSLWARTTANGEDYLSGEVNGVRVVCFRNKSDNPKAPMWRVLKEKPLPPAPAPVTDADIPF